MGYLPNWLTGHDEENFRAGLEADRQRIALNAAKREVRGEAWFADTLKNDAKGAGIADGSGFTPSEFIVDGFSDGIDDGAATIRNGIGSAVSAVALTPLKLIPWNVWLLASVVLFFYFGGASKLLKKS